MLFQTTTLSRRPFVMLGAVGILALMFYCTPEASAQSAPVDLGAAPTFEAAPLGDTPQADLPQANSPYQAVVPDPVLDDNARLQNDLRDLVGQVERQQFELNQMKAAYEKQMSDLQLRLNMLESKASNDAASSGVSSGIQESSADPSQEQQIQIPPQPSPTGPINTPVDSLAPAPLQSPSVQSLGEIQNKTAAEILAGVSNDPSAVYDESFTALKGGNYVAAQQCFQNFLERFPKHTLAPNAKYWLGETYFARKDYAQSSRIFAEGYKAAPKGPKAADNLLKLGLSLAGLNKNKEACVAFAQVGKDFPKGSSAVLSRAVSEMKRLNCAP